MPSSPRRSIRALRLSYELQDPPTHDQAVSEISLAMTRAKGNASEAAREIGVGWRVIQRWIEQEPELRKHVDALRERYGEARFGGEAGRQKATEARWPERKKRKAG